MLEIVGFWIAFGGCALLLWSAFLTENGICWIEKTLHVPWFIQISTPIFAIIILMIGGHIWCLGNGGHYPGYPLKLMITDMSGRE